MRHAENIKGGFTAFPFWRLLLCRLDGTILLQCNTLLREKFRRRDRLSPKQGRTVLAESTSKRKIYVKASDTVVRPFYRIAVTSVCGAVHRHGWLYAGNRRLCHCCHHFGRGGQKRADSYFSLFLTVALAVGAALAVLGLVILRPVAVLLGAKGEMLEYALRYGRILLVSVPTFILQNMFQSFFVTAEKPNLGFAVTVGAGVTNMVLDVVLVGLLGWSVEGAAIATFISQIVGGVLPVFYFLNRNNTSRLHLKRPHRRLPLRRPEPQ